MTTSNKMGNAEKGHNKTGCAKVVALKRHASDCIDGCQKIRNMEDLPHISYPCFVGL